MSSSSEQISPGLFVVRPATAEVEVSGLARLKGKASVSPLGGRLPGWVVKLNKLPQRPRGLAQPAQAAWQRLSGDAGPGR
jgi:hypothetical protein